MKLWRLALVIPIAMLAACGGDDTSQPGGITSGEAQELNDAAAMLDANMIELNALSPAGNGS